MPIFGHLWHSLIQNQPKKNLISTLARSTKKIFFNRGDPDPSGGMGSSHWFFSRPVKWPVSGPNLIALKRLSLHFVLCGVLLSEYLFSNFTVHCIASCEVSRGGCHGMRSLDIKFLNLKRLKSREKIAETSRKRCETGVLDKHL